MNIQNILRPRLMSVYMTLPSGKMGSTAKQQDWIKKTLKPVPRLHLNDPQEFWNNVLWTDASKHECSGNGLMHQDLWCFVVVEATMKSAALQRMLNYPSVNLSWNTVGVIQQGNIQKHKSNAESKACSWCSKACKCHWAEAVLWRGVGQNSSTVVWKSHK